MYELKIKVVYNMYKLQMFIKTHSIQKLKIRLYTKLVSKLTDFSLPCRQAGLVFNSFSLKYLKYIFL